MNYTGTAKCTKSAPIPITVSAPNPFTYSSHSPSSNSSSPASTQSASAGSSPSPHHPLNNSSNSPPPNSQPCSPPPVPVVLSPCAACKILRRRCVEKCVLAPYFPPTEPLKFTIAHRVFGASNIIKFLQELPESQRTDAVSSMVYEANARVRDPVYGSAGAICQLQKQVSDLQAELAKAQAEIANMHQQQANLLAFICMDNVRKSQDLQHHHHQPQQQQQPTITNSAISQHHQMMLLDTTCFLDDAFLSSPWEPLWT